MNREDIIRMARNIASQATHGRNWTYEYAMSVAMQLVEAGAAAEREACAQLAEKAEPYQAADLIRARGQA
jgi:hypothetical protein